MFEQNFGMAKNNLKHNNLLSMHVCARLDMES